MTDVNWLFLDAPHNQNLKYAICFQPNDEILSQEQKNLIPKSHLTDDVITIDVTWDDILWQMLCIGQIEASTCPPPPGNPPGI